MEHERAIFSCAEAHSVPDLVTKAFGVVVSLFTT